ncbi:MAG: ABC transporter ATP-binding protein [Elusimicrobia bacterium]|nr:ABC transporter ATP-binding protein [Elusimicrobiota bacterium]MDE2236657.1 ABC transporter ATP-binding protein [Elusimicrobiota bacterium]MDE2425379.1 ABC transporter ATP-binding protein [Elusimicrobiota bacterium]
MTPAILCEELARVYDGGYRALRGVSFTVGAGEFVAVMGPSGCGKSTLLNILGLLDKPSSGHYDLEGARVSRLGDSERTRLRRERIGFVFQAFNLLPRLSALENVCLPMAYRGLSRGPREERARELLARVGLSRKASHTPLQLSGGERQRVGIARALANRPALLLADEPTGNLDSKSSAEILELFRHLHGEGMTVVLVTHDPGIGKAAQRLLRIKDGLLE